MIWLAALYLTGSAVAIAGNLHAYRRNRMRPRPADVVLMLGWAALWLPFIVAQLWPRTYYCSLDATPWAPASMRGSQRAGGMPELRRMLGLPAPHIHFLRVILVNQNGVGIIKAPGSGE